MPENLGNMHPISKFVQVRILPAACALQVCSVGYLVGCANLIPEIRTSSKIGDRRNERYIVNCPKDLGIWNDVYNL